MKRLSLPSELSSPRKARYRSAFLPATLFIFLFTFALSSLKHSGPASSSSTTSARLLERCKSISTPAGPPPGFQSSTRVKKGSDRQVPGTPPTLIRNAKIWTGTHNGTNIVHGDILLDKGVIVGIGSIPSVTLEEVKKRHGGLQVVDVDGKWVTPGLVDLHSHIGLSSAPLLRGSSETNSRKAPILPWLRSVDGLNTHDAAYELSIAGGVTTAQVLPGSANNIGGQAFLIKLRPTAERSVISRVLEPPQTLVGNRTTDHHHHWRHMKHACGENPDRVYSQTRMDAAWNFRQAYNEARKIRDSQDAFCARVKASNSGWRRFFGVKVAEGEFPESLQWESLVDVLRGRVRLSVHCYEAVDLDVIVRLSNEFKFPIASFHHAGETYLVPELLKKAWGGVPTIALFASNARKKREAYRGSEFAPRVLAANNIPVVMKSDHPVLNSRYLLYEAQQAHYYGLDPALALLSVTSTPAKAAGVGHRVGTIAEGFDADIAVWDSHPLSLGATPTQVYIDGIAQLTNAHISAKPSQLQHIPETPNWDREAQKAVEFEGLPPLRGKRVDFGPRKGKADSKSRAGVKFLDVKSAWMLDEEGDVKTLFDSDSGKGHIVGKTVIVRDGRIACFSGKTDLVQCAQGEQEGLEVVDLQGGSLAPGLTTFGSPIGLVEIRLEPSTTDGVVFDALTGKVPAIVGGDEAVIRAVDGLQFEGRNALLAYRGGVTRAITAPLSNGFLSGLSTTLDVGATSAVERGAVVQAETALHVTLSLRMRVSVSTQIATLRRLLFDSTSHTWNRVREGDIPLVVNVDSADIMATLLKLKSEYEAFSGRALRMTFVGAAEAHLLAREIGNANISVVITSPRPYPGYWENQRIIPGPPLTRHTGITALLAANVNVAIGVMDEYTARNTRFDVAWVALEANGTISRAQAISLATTRLHRALGSTHGADLVAYRGGTLFNLHAKVAGVISFERRSIDLF